MRVWEEIREACQSSRQQWLTGGEIARAVRARNPARSDATVRACVGFYCVNDRSKDSGAGRSYRSNPLLINDDPAQRGKRYRLLTGPERATFLAAPRDDLDLLTYSEALAWLAGRKPGSSPTGSATSTEQPRGGLIRRLRTLFGRPTGVEASRTPPDAKPNSPAAGSDLDAPVAHAADLVLVGCVASKLPGRHRARDLYTSTLFRGRRAYAEQVGAPWYILSAAYGLVRPDSEIDTYDVDLRALPPHRREAWTRLVLSQLDAARISLSGTTVEIHAGSAYRNHGLVQGLELRGANVRVPLEGLPIGRQLSAYRRMITGQLARTDMDTRRPPLAAPPEAPRHAPVPPERVRTIAEALTRDFMDGSLDLSARPGALAPGWAAMPEFQTAQRWRASGATGAEVRLLLTLVAMLDRARDSYRLWDNAATLFEKERWSCLPETASLRPLPELRATLAAYGVSQRHTSDVAAWRAIQESLTDPAGPQAVRSAVYDGSGDALELLTAVKGNRSPGNPWFPFLRGPKVSVMWVRMLAWPGGATIANLAVLPVAVDVQIRRVTEYLGVTDSRTLTIDAARPVIQAAWREAASAAVGPGDLSGTGAALDPALWFYAKWGCSFCELWNAPKPIGRACDWCTLRNQRS